MLQLLWAYVFQCFLRSLHAFDCSGKLLFDRIDAVFFREYRHLRKVLFEQSHLLHRVYIFFENTCAKRLSVILIVWVIILLCDDLLHIIRCNLRVLRLVVISRRFLVPLWVRSQLNWLSSRQGLVCVLVLALDIYGDQFCLLLSIRWHFSRSYRGFRLFRRCSRWGFLRNLSFGRSILRFFLFLRWHCLFLLLWLLIFIFGSFCDFSRIYNTRLFIYRLRSNYVQKFNLRWWYLSCITLNSCYLIHFSLNLLLLFDFGLDQTALHINILRKIIQISFKPWKIIDIAKIGHCAYFNKVLVTIVVDSISRNNLLLPPLDVPQISDCIRNFIRHLNIILANHDRLFPKWPWELGVAQVVILQIGFRVFRYACHWLIKMISVIFLLVLPFAFIFISYNRPFHLVVESFRYLFV